MGKLSIAIALFLAVMIGLEHLSKWLITGISRDFGDGVFVGFVLAASALALAEKVNPKRR
ncbi:hypothetical protein M2322_003184 [Rhodoblastus acidophilus]|uniref:hypothetical protein n=1 Tax=Rhodoblastus acidophilus TaxID=1074 RepID=UPI002224DD61|nr:hypothetical protein [Rhodoblastus acidophilus]MCW2317620.1 hypothetical protein [Rhodoblastus acidophilus]